jgi:hypothetical protein
LTDGPAPPKFLRAKVGFTFSVGGDMERRFSSHITEKSKSSKKISKMRKTLKASNLRICFLKIFLKKQEVESSTSFL